MNHKDIKSKVLLELIEMMDKQAVSKFKKPTEDEVIESSEEELLDLDEHKPEGVSVLVAESVEPEEVEEVEDEEAELLARLEEIRAKKLRK